jgi:glucose-1-phosphate thymidylyltransferase
MRAGAKITALEAVGNRPILHHLLDTVRETSTGGVIFAGDADALIDVRASLLEYEPELARTDYVVCPASAGIGLLLGAVAGVVGDATCLMQPADGLLEEPILPLIQRVSDVPFDTLLLVAGGTITQRAKWWSGSSESGVTGEGIELLGVGVFGPGALTSISRQLRDAGESDLGATARRPASHDAHYKLHPVNGWYRYRGYGTDLLELNRIVLDRLPRDVPESLRADNRIEGRVSIHPSVDIRSSVVVGPVVIGPGSTIRDAYIGPYTAIGAGVHIEGAEIERSIISPGASVRHVGSRLISSLVGRDTRVFRDLSLPRAVRLWTGEGDEVALC